MKVLVQIVEEPLEAALASLAPEWRGAAPGRVGETPWQGDAGAWLDFWGIARATEDGAPIRALRYEAHPTMAVHQVEEILRRLPERGKILAFLVLHRLGEVPVGEPSLLVRILSPHRAEAITACATFIDELKKWVPIWKHAVR